MDQVIKDFSLTGLASIAVMVVVCSAFIRRIIELSVPSLVKDERQGANTKVVMYKSGFARWYNEFLLYLIPYVVAALSALANTEFLFGAVKTYVGRLFLAVFVATFSSLAYKALRKAIPALFGVTVEDDTEVLPTPPRF